MYVRHAGGRGKDVVEQLTTRGGGGGKPPPLPSMETPPLLDSDFRVGEECHLPEEKLVWAIFGRQYLFGFFWCTKAFFNFFFGVLDPPAPPAPWGMDGIVEIHSHSRPRRGSVNFRALTAC